MMQGDLVVVNVCTVYTVGGATHIALKPIVCMVFDSVALARVGAAELVSQDGTRVLVYTKDLRRV